MPHIHTQPGEHDHTITAFIIRTDGSEPRALLHMHSKLHMLLPVGGHIELNETPWQALAHEVAEEAGYALDQLAVLQPRERIQKLGDAQLHPLPIAYNTHTITEDHLHTDASYALATTTVPRLAVGANESQDLRWVTLAELRNIPANDIRENIRITYEFIFATCLPTWERVAATTYAH